MMAPSSSMQLLVALLSATSTALAATSDTVQSCLTTGGVEATISTEENWTNETLAFQFRAVREPIAVAHPTTKDQVAVALACARDASVQVTALGRAHSFQGYGFGNPGNLVIDMKSFTELSFDSTTNELTFGGGANVGPAAKFLWDGYKRHFPHVRGSHVGLVGSTMGGGYGTTSRFLGIPSDNLASVEFMLANGTIVNATAGSDLLWAAQGAGPNFGIVLSAKTKTFEVPIDGAVSYSLALNTEDPATAAAALVGIQTWATDSAPDTFSLRYSLANFASAGFFYGTEAEFDAAFNPLVESLKTIVPDVNLTKTVLTSFWDSEVAAVGTGMNDANGGTLGGRSSLVQSWVVTGEKPLSLAQATNLLENYHSINRTDLTNTGFADLWGGVSRDISDSDTAFAHGNNLWLIRVDGVAPSHVWPADGIEYMQSLMNPFESSLKKSAPLRSFVNYIDSELSEKEWSNRLYGDANFKRLRTIKGAVDPNGLFSGFGLAVPTS